MSDRKIIEGKGRDVSAEQQLYRSITNRSVAGVCGGLGERFGVDVGIIRLAWLFSVFLTMGISLIPYAVLALAVPKESQEHAAAKAVPSSDLWQQVRSNPALLYGALLVMIGAVLLLNVLGLLPWRLETLWGAFWALALPLAVIGVGVFLVLGVMGKAPDWRQWRDLRGTGYRMPLRRSRADRTIAGVCGGVARFFQIDPLVVRIGYVMLTVLTGFAPGVVIYALAAFFIPQEAGPLQQ
ncbi:MAG: PspC domain-containing protein [Caldilineales bacterium]